MKRSHAGTNLLYLVAIGKEEFCFNVNDLSTVGTHNKNLNHVDGMIKLAIDECDIHVQKQLTKIDVLEGKNNSNIVP